eukprot:4143559-Pleurochrysis_carterae.AAC.1
MVGQQQLRSPWPATFVELVAASAEQLTELVRQAVQQLGERDALVDGKRVMAYNKQGFRWSPASILRVGSSDKESIDVLANGWQKLAVGRSDICVVSEGGVGAALRAAATAGHEHLVKSLLQSKASMCVVDAKLNSALHLAARA